MKNYLVLWWKPFDSNRKVFLKKFENIDFAKNFANDMKINRYDVLIVKDLKKKVDGIDSYNVEKYGFYKIYRLLNKSLIFLFILLLLFCYLYYKYIY